MSDAISRDALLKKVKDLQKDSREDFQADSNVQMGYLTALDDVIKEILKLRAVK